MNLELIAFTKQGRELAVRLAGQLTGAGHAVRCTRRAGQSASDWTAQAFARAQGLIFVGAAGIAVRSIAPCLRHKSTDPAVVVVDEAGRFVVPILSGHLGGANDLSREIAALLGGQAVITTATDGNGVFAADQWARVQNVAVCNPERIAAVSSALLEGRTVPFWSRWPIQGKPPAGLQGAAREAAELVVDFVSPAGRRTWAEKAEPGAPLWLCPRTLRLGIGCRRGTGMPVIRRLLQRVLEEEGLPQQGLEAVCTLDRKGDEPGLLEFCRALKLPLLSYSAQALAQVPGTFSASPFVQEITGVDNVCERAALAAGGVLVRRKTAQDGVTLALAVRTPHLDWRDGR